MSSLSLLGAGALLVLVALPGLAQSRAGDSAARRVSDTGSAPAHGVATSPDSLGDLPLVQLSARGDSTDMLAVFVSGDGNWAALDKQLARAVAEAGIPVVGIKARAYFRTARTPEMAAADLARVMRHYLEVWHRQRVVLIGYSRGAEVVPFMVAHLPWDLRERVRLVALLGAARNANFKFHAIDLISNRNRKDDLPVQPEIEKLRGTRVLCFYGTDEANSVCKDLDPTLASSIALKGGHHFGGGYDVIGREIADRARFW